MDIEAALEAFAQASKDDVGRLLMMASRTVNESVLTAIDPTGATGVRLAHVPVIAMLDAEGTRIGDIASRIGITRQATAVLCKDLDGLGMVTCLPDPADGRAIIVRLTAKGARLCEQAVEVMDRQEAELASMLGAQGLEQLRASLRLIAEPQARS